MPLEDEYLDVLQNIEFAIVSVYKEQRDLRDLQVMRALDALIECYRAESHGHSPKQHNLPEPENLVFERVKSMCEFRLGRENSGVDALDLSDGELTVDEMLSCLRKVRRSVEKWNRRNGRQGYLQFVSQFVR
ncbi:MAG: hypothetical protein U1F76_05065 [Candidatus Competibacteraceae bacterium]